MEELPIQFETAPESLCFGQYPPTGIELFSNQKLYKPPALSPFPFSFFPPSTIAMRTFNILQTWNPRYHDGLQLGLGPRSERRANPHSNTGMTEIIDWSRRRRRRRRPDLHTSTETTEIYSKRGRRDNLHSNMGMTETDWRRRRRASNLGTTETDWRRIRRDSAHLKMGTPKIDWSKCCSWMVDGNIHVEVLFFPLGFNEASRGRSVEDDHGTVR